MKQIGWKKYYKFIYKGMSGIFSICQCENDNNQQVSPQPIKFRILKAFNLLDPILKNFVLPSKKEQYNFNREHLYHIQRGQKNHIPVVYLPAKKPQTSMIFVYSHGSGSTLNNVYGFGYNIMVRYGIAVLLYDYNGEGESQGQFVSYEDDIKTVLSWVFKQGYSPQRTLLCGFSIGSYPTLCVPGPMPRMLISPICGFIPLIEGNSKKYEGQNFDNIGNASKIKARSVIIHCKEEFVPISHSHAIVDALSERNDSQSIDFYEIDGYNHQNAPSFLVSQDANKLMKDFLKKVLTEAKEKLKQTDKDWQMYYKELKLSAKFVNFEKARSSLKQMNTTQSTTL